MARVPKKNVSSNMTDIRAPQDTNSGGIKAAIQSEIKPFVPTRPLVRRFIMIFLAFVVGLLCLALIFVYGVRWYVGNKIEQNVNKVGQILRPGERAQFEKSTSSFGFGDMWNAFRHAGDLWKTFQGSSNGMFTMIGDLENLERDWPGIFAGNGRAALMDLTHLRDSLDDMSRNDAVIQSGVLQPFVPVNQGALFSLGIDLMRAKNFLDEFIPWFASDSERHVAVLFLNSAELRPGGGFIGSYGDAVIKNGSLARFEVHDINETVSSSSPKIIPPKELQGVTLGWHAADSNWFFDFSDSAKKFLELMPASTSFDGVVAISPRVVSDMLTLTGPVQLGDGTVLTSTSTIALIQSDVEQAQAEHAPDPKKILKEAAPLIIKQMAKASSATNSGNQILALMSDWFAKKDVMVYFKDQTMQSFFDTYGLTGTMFDLPSDYYGDYLALVRANVAGGKTDTFINQDVQFQSTITEDGQIMDKLKINRKFSPPNNVPWWNKVKNQTYLTAFAPRDAKLMSAEGGVTSTIHARLNYAKRGYASDPDIQNLESTEKIDPAIPQVTIFSEAGRTVFGLWSVLAAGAADQTEMDYVSMLPTLPAPGKVFRFVMEKQPESYASYHLRFIAPIGLHFAENHSGVFDFSTDNPDGRTEIDLTFEKAE